MRMDSIKKPQIKLVEINPHITCPLCKGYFIDATTISECLHSFCRSCIIKFLHENSYCPVCELIINKAKPNLKLDKTLQDIVYKLVPELFLNEMRRRQRFYQSYPELATVVSPEEKGEDTERTIFNPRDTISLSIEYISDDSTPGAIAIPHLIGRGNDRNNKNTPNELADDDENNVIRRFLQCPGMCRMDVLKKFIRNKYNVDTNQYYIDILYKRVPLPDHYTLIDVAYIYSWKRNEPMKFFFKITDINLVSDSYDYLIPAPAAGITERRTPRRLTTKHRTMQDNINKTEKTSSFEEPQNKETTSPTRKPVGSDNTGTLIRNTVQTSSDKKSDDATEIVNVESTVDKVDMLRIQKEAIEQFKKNEKRKEFTNVTLDRNNHLEIITKIQKVSNKSGLQIGIKITKQTFKKNQAPKLHEADQECDKSEKLPSIEGSPNAHPPLETDLEKSNFLKSIELTATHVIKTMVPQVLVPKTQSKRKNISPEKSKKGLKKLKKYADMSKAVWKTVGSTQPKSEEPAANQVPSTTSDLQALLYDSYKINIPSSLSVTVKNEKDNHNPSFQTPVQNYIEILKLPEIHTPPPTKQIEPEARPNINLNKLEIKSEPGTPEIEKRLLSLPQDLDIKVENGPEATSDPDMQLLSPRAPQTFQNMFEEMLKKPEPTSPTPKVSNSLVQKTALNLSTNESAKRKITDIASKLYKKKLEGDKPAPLHLPLPPTTPKPLPLKDFDSYISQQKSNTQTIANLHSPKLGLNYTVSVSQGNGLCENNQLDTKVNGLRKPEFVKSPKTEIPQALSLPKKPTVLNVPRKYTSSSEIPSRTPAKLPKYTTSPSDKNHLNPDQILEKYNIQNLAQLTANFSFPPNLVSSTANQLAALRQAMICKHFEMQNHQNWLNMNPGPLVQYEQYLKSLSKSST